MNNLPLQGQRIVLRAVEPSDLDMLFMLENEPGRAESSFTTAPLSRQMLWQYVNDYKADIYSEGQLRLIIEADDKAIGAIDISDYQPRDRRGFVGIAILQQYRRQGYGLEALELLCKYAANTLGMHQLVAVVAVDNTPSRALFDAAGFSTAGRLRSWVRSGRHYTDVLLYQMLFA